ncbi:hypothetical protein [Cecembia calidifontis]|nr:hypothetical protein [Cecembia calidifontis]
MKKFLSIQVKKYANVAFVVVLMLMSSQVLASKEVSENLRVEDEALPELVLELQELKTSPSVTIINKYGEIIAQFYGAKEEIESKFLETFEKSKFILNHGNHYFYLMD